MNIWKKKTIELCSLLVEGVAMKKKVWIKETKEGKLTNNWVFTIYFTRKFSTEDDTQTHSLASSYSVTANK